MTKKEDTHEKHIDSSSKFCSKKNAKKKDNQSEAPVSDGGEWQESVIYTATEDVKKFKSRQKLKRTLRKV